VAGEDQQKQAVIRTWNGKAAKCEIEGDSIVLDEWEKLGLKEGGMRVTSVSGEAEKAGIKVGDIITGLVGEGEADEKGVKADAPVRGSASLVVWACLEEIGSKHSFRIKRADKTSTVEVKLVDYGWKGEFPEKYRSK
jgi:C-terminal processing protease CtpA/Prc